MRVLFTLLLVLSLGVHARPWVLLFGSENCDECAEIKSIWAERDDEEGPVLVYVSIDRDENYSFLKEVEQTLGISRPGSAFPILLVGNRLVQGVDGLFEVAPEMDELMEKLPGGSLFEGISSAAATAEGSMAVWNRRVSEKAPAAGKAGVRRLLYLSSPGCKKCARQEVELRLLKKKLPELTIDNYQVTTDEGQVFLARVRKHFNIKEDESSLAPAVIWNDGYVSGRLAGADELEKALEKPEGTPFWEGPVSDGELKELKSSRDGFLENMTWSTAVIAGLVDGINPCAFATVIFLVSYLLVLKRSRRFILATGICFCAGVFISYLLFGIGLSYIVDYLNNFRYVKKAMYFFFALVALVCSVMHFRDALRFRRSGKESDMDMKLGKDTHRKIHDRIHRWGRMGTWLIWPAAVLLGILVSSLEFVCTGQIYLPTIMAINSGGFNLKALAGLVVYNLAFILPLLAVTVLAYAGTGARVIADAARKHLVATKTIMAVMFLMLAVLMACLA